MNGHARTVLVAIALSACAATACGGSKKRLPSTPASASPDSDLGLDELRKDLESTVLENYNQVSLGNVEATADAVSLEDELVLFGPTPRDVLVGVMPAGLRADRRLFRTRGPTVLSKNLDVHLAKDGSVGWIFDEVSYRVDYMGREASVPIRVTGIYVRDVERWVLVSEHQSYAIPISEIKRLATGGALVPGKAIETSYGSSRKLAGTLVGIIGRFINGQLEDGVVLDSSETLILLPAPENEYHGSDALEAPSLASIFGPNTSVAVREFRVELGSSGRVAWINANLAVRTELAGERSEIMLRGSFLFERSGKDDWALLQSHISAPLLEKEISQRVFGPDEE